MNTHLDNASEQAADFGANIVMNKLNELKEKYNNTDGTVLTGDFNETQDGTAYKLVASKLNDCTNRAKRQPHIKSGAIALPVMSLSILYLPTEKQ